MHLGLIIKEYREKNRLSMDDFSYKSGLSKSYISMLEKNNNPSTGKEIAPTIDVIKKVANAIKIDFNELFSMLGDDFITLDEKDIPTQTSVDPKLIKLDDLEFALYGEIKEMTEDDKEELLEYVRWNRERKANKK